MPWHKVKGHSGCPASKPWAVIKDSDGSVAGCHATEKSADDQLAALYATEPAAGSEDPMTTVAERRAELGGKPNPGTKKDKRLKANAEGTVETFAPVVSGMGPAEMAGMHWEGVLVVEGSPTGDGREFAEDSIDWPDTKAVTMPLQWQKESSHGGDHDVTVSVGRIDYVWRDGKLIRGVGRFDTHPDAVEAMRRMHDGMLTGVSILADDITDADVEYVWADDGIDGSTEDPEEDILALLFKQPEKIVFHKARLRAATLCDVPAYVESTLHTIGEVAADVDGFIASVTELAAVGTHSTETSSGAWDGAANEKRLPSPMPLTTARKAYAYIDDGEAVDGDVPKSAGRFIHHEVSADGTPGPANTTACSTGIGVLHGGRGGTTIPNSAKQSVYNHLAKHLRDAGQEPPPFDLRTALVAHAWHDTWRPPAEWFEDPGINVPTPIVVTDQGRVFGLACEWTECHLGYIGECQLPPREAYHDRFMTGAIPTSDGKQVAVGQITAGIPHAPLYYSASRASEHYDNTDAVVADVAVGNCRAGIWVAGAIRPNANPDRVHALRASGQVSPDWRKVGGVWKMVGLLTVNVSGYQVPKVRTHSNDEGVLTTMVASGMVSVHSPFAEQERDRLRHEALLARRRELSERINGRRED